MGCQQRVSAQPCFGWPSLPRDPISFPGSDAQWITNCTHANDPVVIPQEDVGRDKFLTRLFDVCGADVHADVVSVAGFSSRPAAKYVWVAIEDGKRAWYISPEGLQPGFDSVFSLVLPHVAACFGILDLLHMETDLLRREASKTEELEKTNRELQERDRQTHQLVLRMAHLVSRPILELRLGADHLISNPSSTSVRQRFGKCLFDLKRASANFQAYASLDSREVDRQEAITSFDIVGVLWRARDAVAPLGNFKRRPIALNIPKEFLGGKYVLGRRSALLEILVNILHNGIKYSFGGREVAVELRERDRGISVSFTNYGCGIAEDERDKIFEPEYRSEMAKQFEAEGAGMGLAIARSLAVRGGGDLQLLSCDPFDLLEIRPGTERKRYQTVFELWYPSP